MDMSTWLGLISGIIIIVLAVMSGSDMDIFINVPGFMIVAGGTLAATLIKFPLSDCIHSSFLALRTAFGAHDVEPSKLIQESIRLSGVVRSSGVKALEDEVVKNRFFQKGLMLCSDNRDEDFIRKLLTKEMNLSIERHEIGERIFRSIGDSAPAFGLIGTLVGLVQMLSNMQDPNSIGPAMAIALLTTLYGAVIANLFAFPIADKLQHRNLNDRLASSLIIEGVIGIKQGQNPRMMEDILESYLPSNLRRRATD